jgi:formylglycine-generating enzyme required for sulfatase activity
MTISFKQELMMLPEGVTPSFLSSIKTIEFNAMTSDDNGMPIQVVSEAMYFSETVGRNKVKMEMIHIPHPTQPFYIGKSPVTQEQYASVMRGGTRAPFQFKGENLSPAERITYHSAILFCEKISEVSGKLYRLPTATEWEYACRAGTTTSFYFGDNLTPDLANYGKTIGRTTPVGKYPPNAFGLYDMHGNVGERCSDTAETSQQRTYQNRVCKGGSWDRHQQGCTSSDIVICSEGSRSKSLGFRVAISTQWEEYENETIVLNS